MIDKSTTYYDHNIKQLLNNSRIITCGIDDTLKIK